MQLGDEEIKLSVFPNGRIVYVNNPKELTKKTPGTNKHSKVAGYQVNMQKSIAFLYTRNEQLECKI